MHTGRKLSENPIRNTKMICKKHAKRLTLLNLLAIVICLSGCAETPTQTPIVVKKVYTGCLAFKKETWSVDDTLESANATRRRNAAYAKLCRKK
jgi:hypothetical protein